jgi:hypothetical protein
MMTNEPTMVARMKRPLVSSVVVLALVAGLGTLASGCVLTVGSTPIANCTATKGVIVAVDFSHFGKASERGCDPTTTTGYAALQAAGFVPAGDQQDGPAFVCRINDLPSPSQDPCVQTPPSTAFWSYWHANAGKTTWTLSGLGASTYQPKPGSVDAWAFGARTPPTFTPAQVRN